MVESIIPYHNFNGDGSEAVALGAKMIALKRWKDMPDGDVPPELAEQIMYAHLEIGGAAIELGDVPPTCVSTREAIPVCPFTAMIPPM